MGHRMDDATREAARTLLALAHREDLGGSIDLTTCGTIPDDQVASVQICSRQAGILCGVELVAMVLEYFANDDDACDTAWDVRIQKADGSAILPGDTIAILSGRVRLLLTAERTILNFMTHLCGVASLTAAFVSEAAGARAVVLDTRKTLPGYRRLQKYAVACGGGRNHRMGLYDGILIKDNHLAARGHLRVAQAVSDIRTFAAQRNVSVPVEVEVDSLEQLKDVLTAGPDIVLLDNMNCEQLSAAVSMRDRDSPSTLLEASGGVCLSTVKSIAATGVDRISVGSLTHSAPSLDLGFDWPW